MVFAALATNIFASDILTLYRNNGIANIEKQMDLELTKEDYWDKQIDKKDTTFGFVESYENILYCDKSQPTLEYYKLDGQKYKLQKSHKAYVGKLDGDKKKEGDLKTPVGVYNLTQKLSKDTKLDIFYGPYAFVTTYPNLYDKYQNKSGSGIWIHGLPPENVQRDSFTRGCIAIQNNNIECLNNNINLDKTILIIDEKPKASSISRETLVKLLTDLYKWRFAWKYDEIDNYLSYYDDAFVRDDGMKIDEFKTYKKRVFSKNERKSIVFNKIDIFAYPNSSDVYQITFNEEYRSDSFKFSGGKVLIVKLEKNQDRFKILTEK